MDKIKPKRTKHSHETNKCKVKNYANNSTCKEIRDTEQDVIWPERNSIKDQWKDSRATGSGFSQTNLDILSRSYYMNYTRMS